MFESRREFGSKFWSTIGELWSRFIPTTHANFTRIVMECIYNQVGFNKLCLIIFVSIVHVQIKRCIWQWFQLAKGLTAHTTQTSSNVNGKYAGAQEEFCGSEKNIINLSACGDGTAQGDGRKREKAIARAKNTKQWHVKNRQQDRLCGSRKSSMR